MLLYLDLCLTLDKVYKDKNIVPLVMSTKPQGKDDSHLQTVKGFLVVLDIWWYLS